MSDQNILDEVDLKSLKPDLSFDNGFNFATHTRFTLMTFGLFIFLGLVFSILSTNLIGIGFATVLLIPISYGAFSRGGVDLNFEHDHYREYINFLGWKSGKWKTAYGLTDVSILTMNKTARVGGMSNSGGMGVGYMGPQVSLQEKETAVYLLTPSHRKRRLISICKNYDLAEKRAKEIAEKMDKSFKKFNPQISEATKARRYR